MTLTVPSPSRSAQEPAWRRREEFAAEASVAPKRPSASAPRIPGLGNRR
eukprot:COSAG04_NODE_7417_length_1132_cov_1.066796_2_plen_49_part_00